MVCVCGLYKPEEIEDAIHPMECYVATERERCAKIAEKEANEWDMIDDNGAMAARNVATLIRSED